VRDAAPAINQPELLEDLFQHVALLPKWRHLMAGIWHIREPCNIITSIQDKPVEMRKGLTVLNVNGLHGDIGAPKMISRQRLLGHCEVDHVILVDVAAEVQFQTRRVLTMVAEASGLSWEGPFRSLGSSHGQKRLTCRLYTPRGEGTELGQHMLTMALRKDPLLQYAVVGPEQLLNEPGARVLELTTLAAVPGFSDLLGDAVVLNAAEVLFLSSAPLADWEERLTRVLKDDPSTAGIQVKWRRMVHGGRPWAKPRLLDSMVRTVTQRAKKTAGRATVDDDVAQLRLEGPLGSRPEELLTEVMRKVGELLQEDLRPQKNDRKLEMGQWRMSMDMSGRPTGRVDVRLASLQRIAEAQRMIAQTAVLVNGVLVPLALHSEALVAGTFRRPG
jgi:hypothetical protein